MSADDRKTRIRAYKETPRAAGIYQIRNRKTGRILLGSAMNVQGRLNRHRFELSTGSHPDADLQNDWKELGDAEFEFVVLDVLEPREDPSYDLDEELGTLEEMWRERLRTSGESQYDWSDPTRRE